MQTNSDGKWLPIQWASKKLTSTEKKIYYFREKNVGGVKKFEYELKGRKIEIMTDHKALEEIRNKPSFNNNRINRMIEKIQEFDFTIQYVKGENMIDVDALSRQFQEEGEEEQQKKETKIMKQKLGKENNHKLSINGIDYWEFDSVGHES